MPQEQPTSLTAKLGGVAVAIFLACGGFEVIEGYVRSKRPHDLLTTLHYKGEWTSGEYRECESSNLKEYDKPNVVCADASSAPAKLFKVRFSGFVLDPKQQIGQPLNWTCRRVNDEVTFSCVRNQMPEIPSEPQSPSVPVEHDLTKDDLENLRKRNECEQRFYDKRMYQANENSIGEPCRQNPDLRP